MLRRRHQDLIALELGRPLSNPTPFPSAMVQGARNRFLFPLEKTPGERSRHPGARSLRPDVLSRHPGALALVQPPSAKEQGRRELGQGELSLLLFQREKDQRPRDDHPVPFSRLHRRRALVQRERSWVLCRLTLRPRQLTKFPVSFSRTQFALSSTPCRRSRAPGALVLHHRRHDGPSERRRDG
jgi:hypothetical protein